jgi:hypothetical protein
MGSQAIAQADRLVGNIGSRQKKNNMIIAFTISICLGILAWHYNFFGLSTFLFWSSTSSEKSTASPESLLKPLDLNFNLLPDESPPIEVHKVLDQDAGVLEKIEKNT